MNDLERILFALVMGSIIVAFVVVWGWGMWIAFTKGDDPIARFGRHILGKKDNE